jgi:hypothetical protein
VITAARYQVDTAPLRLPAAGLLAGGIVLAHLPSGVGLPCPLRSLTGIPCPFCGLTTSLRAVGGAHLATALRAAPLGLLVVVAALLTLLGRLPTRIRFPLPLLGLAVVAEWIFELVRFHLL